MEFWGYLVRKKLYFDRTSGVMCAKVCKEELPTKMKTTNEGANLCL